MRNPVIGSDGITYERAAIEEWFAHGNHTSPVTRAPMNPSSLVPNYALKALLEEGTPASAPAPTPSSVDDPAPPIEIQVTIHDPAQHIYNITVTAPDVSEYTLPTLFIDVLDNSGSMGGSCMDVRRAAGAEAAAFSRSDLVRHSVATQIELLRHQDELAVILFDHNAELVLDATRMSHGRAIAKTVLPKIRPNGGTNIWTGLHAALQIAAAAPPTQNVVIILQTDGESDASYNPPRGIVASLQAWLDTHPRVRPTIHTVGYGFGAVLDMPLLRQIATIGRGTVNYIPDGSMVGTVFIHMMANLMSCVYRDLTLHVPEAGIAQPIGFLQSGQTRTFQVRLPPGPHTVTVGGTTVDIRDPPPHHPDPTTSLRLATIQMLRDLLGAAGDRAAERLATLRDIVSGADPTPLMTALLTDLYDADPNKGQIGKAFASADAFERWGRHYIPCVISSLENEWAINFKDETSKVFGTPLTRSLIQCGDTLFMSLPPPTPSLLVRSTDDKGPVAGGRVTSGRGAGGRVTGGRGAGGRVTGGRGAGSTDDDSSDDDNGRGVGGRVTSGRGAGGRVTGGRGAGGRVTGGRGAGSTDDDSSDDDNGRGVGGRFAGGRVAGGTQRRTVPSMASVYDPHGVCFLPASQVRMANGGWVRCDQVRPGDQVAEGYTVRCILKTLVTRADIVRVGSDVNPDGGFTMWHPVFRGGRWQHPADIGHVTQVATDCLYNFVLDKGHTLIVDGVMTCTLGHRFTGPVIEHPYFGHGILADLQASPGWGMGRITWDNSCAHRDSNTGLITHMTFQDVSPPF